MASLPSNLKKADFKNLTDSLNKQNLDLGYNIPFVKTWHDNHAEFKKMTMYQYYSLGSYHKPSDKDSIIYYMKKIEKYPKWSFGLIEYNKAISGIGQIFWDRNSSEMAIADSVANTINLLNEKLKHKFYPSEYSTYLFSQRRIPLYKRRTNDIQFSKMQEEIPLIKRIRLNTDILSMVASIKGIGISFSLEPTLKLTNYSYFGLKASYTRFVKESNDYSFYYQVVKESTQNFGNLGLIFC